MWTPQLSSRVDRFQKVGGQVVAAVEAVPEMRDIAKPLHDVLARLQAADEARGQARAVAVARRRLRDQAEGALDQAVRQAYLDLLSAVGGDKRRAPFQGAFPDGVSPILDPVPARRMPLVMGLEERLKSLDGQSARAEAIATARQAFEATVQAVMVAEAAEANARTEVAAAKVAFDRELRIVYGHLTALLGDPRKVAAFFPAGPQKALRPKPAPAVPVQPGVE